PSRGELHPSEATPPASHNTSHGAARSYGELFRICPPPTRSNSSRIPGTSSTSRDPTSITASNWPVTIRVIANAWDPSSNVPPPTDEESIKSPRTSVTRRDGRPRNPKPQNMRPTSSHELSATDREDVTPPPRPAR